MRFTKMHGLGNDFILMDVTSQSVTYDLTSLAKRLCHRHQGIGGDGLILIEPSEIADFTMTIYNSDGSQAAMCGNGARCVGKYIGDRKLTDKTEFTLETKAGIRKILLRENGEITVDMGKPILDTAKIPASFVDPTYIDKPLTVGSESYAVTLVSMGNPHCVVFEKDVDSLDLPALGPKFEYHDRFPDRVNTEFIQVLDSQNLKMRVWERGAGETMACGTGACASAVAARMNGFTDREVTVHLAGGSLHILLSDEDHHVYMTGSATFVYDGVLYE